MVEPKIVLSEGKRIKGLDGNEKMGKSLGNAIYLSDTEEEITRKVMSAVTDPNRIKKDDLGNIRKKWIILIITLLLLVYYLK